MKNLWNTMIDRLQETAEKREAEKSEDEAEELYPCGDGVRLKIFDEVSSLLFLRQSGTMLLSV